VSNYVFEMNAVWNPYAYFFVKIYVEFVANIDIKILGVPRPWGWACFSYITTHAHRGQGYLFLPRFSSLYDVIHGWMMGRTDGWTSCVMKKAS
jgi:hypothetical protein